MIRHRLVLSALAAGCAAHAASAQPFVQAQATDNSGTVFAPNNNMMGSGSGVTIAGAKVFHGPDQDYEVSNGLGIGGKTRWRRPADQRTPLRQP